MLSVHFLARWPCTPPGWASCEQYAQYISVIAAVKLAPLVHSTLPWCLLSFTHSSNRLSLLHFLHPSRLHSFTLNSKLTFSVNPFHHRSLAGDMHSGLSFSANGTLFRFYSAYKAAQYATTNPSVCLSVRHTPVLCQNEGTQKDAAFTVV